MPENLCGNNFSGYQTLSYTFERHNKTFNHCLHQETQMTRSSVHILHQDYFQIKSFFFLLQDMLFIWYLIKGFNCLLNFLFYLPHSPIFFAKYSSSMIVSFCVVSVIFYAWKSLKASQYEKDFWQTIFNGECCKFALYPRACSISVLDLPEVL